jgi:hypothetical protein
MTSQPSKPLPCLQLSRRLVAQGLIGSALGIFTGQQALAGPPREVGDPEPTSDIRLPMDHRPRRGDRPLVDGKIARGNRQIVAAWFADPTDRYRHFCLGTEHEPASLVVALKDRRTVQFTLPADSVFEDRAPRLIDVDGVDMILTVRSYLKSGAALCLLGVGNNELEIVAETPPVGQPFRWLNPVGAADFDGDGVLDLALVRTPHIGGVLQIWTARGGKLEQTYEIDDVCNHVIGSPHQALSVIADFNGDGRPDLAVPSQDRRRLRFLSFSKGRVSEFGRVELTAPASENFVLSNKGGRLGVQVGFPGGRTQLVQLSPA